MTKILKYIYKYVFALLALTYLVSCEEDDNKYPQLGEDPRTITQIAADTPEISTFSGALNRVGLDATLNTTTTYTVIAPNNGAFTGVDLNSLTDEQLEQILLNHVISTTTPDFSASLESGYVLSMSTMGPDDTNLSIYIDNSDKLTFNGVATVVAGRFDIGATNGVIHVVDAMLPPPTVADHIKANPDFSTLAEAIELAGLESELDGENINTVFAPTNAAFEAFIADLTGAFGWTTLQDIPVDVLTDVLLYHVTAENNVSGDIDGTTFDSALVIDDTAQTFSVSGTQIDDASYTNANLGTDIDIQGINGVVHAIDKVLVYEEVFQLILDQTLNLYERIEDRGYSTFFAAAEKAGLEESLSSDELTAFVPNNEAFVIFFLTIDNFESLDDFDTDEELDLLRSLLEYHLYAGTLLNGGLTDGPLTTIEGSDLTVEGTSLLPSLAHANPGVIANANIGATNGVIHEINNILVPASLEEGLGYPPPPSGEPVYGYEIFHDVRDNDLFWFGGWAPATVEGQTDPVRSGLYSIRVDFTNNEAFQMGVQGTNTTLQPLSEYSTVHASVYSETGTQVIMALNGQYDMGQTVDIPAGEWVDISAPVSVLAGSATNLSEFNIRSNTGVANTIYIDQIAFDLTFESSVPSLSYVLFTDVRDNDLFWFGGWAPLTQEGQTDPVREGLYSIRVDFANNEAFQMGVQGTNTTLQPLSEYSTVHASVYSETGTQVIMALNGQYDMGQTVDIPAGEWVDISAPVSVLAGSATDLTEFNIRSNTGIANTIYIDNIGFN